MSKPIAMRMNAEQFESIKGILEDNGYKCNEYPCDSNPYVSCILDNKQIINCYGVPEDIKIHEEFNAKVFLNSLGIDYEEPQITEQVERYNIFDKAQQLIKDAKQQGVEIEIKEGVIILKQVVK